MTLGEKQVSQARCARFAWVFQKSRKIAPESVRRAANKLGASVFCKQVF